MVTTARYRPRRRTANGDTSRPTAAEARPAASSHTGRRVTPNPSTRPFGSPDRTAAVYAPMPRKNAWPSDTCPAYPVTRFSPMAPMHAARPVANTTSSPSVATNGSVTANASSAVAPQRLPVVFNNAASCA